MNSPRVPQQKSNKNIGASNRSVLSKKLGNNLQSNAHSSRHHVTTNSKKEKNLHIKFDKNTKKQLEFDENQSVNCAKVVKVKKLPRIIVNTTKIKSMINIDTQNRSVSPDGLSCKSPMSKRSRSKKPLGKSCKEIELINSNCGSKRSMSPTRLRKTGMSPKKVNHTENNDDWMSTKSVKKSKKAIPLKFSGDLTLKKKNLRKELKNKKTAIKCCINNF